MASIDDFPAYLDVDPEQGFKAQKIKILSCFAPTMRSFHVSWATFFIAFLGWFAFAPLMPVVRADLGLTDGQIWTANITSVMLTIVARFIVGPMCDQYGPRLIQSFLMIWGCIMVAFSTLIQDATGLTIIRLFIGIVGSTFVPTQYWGSSLFTKEIAGTAQAISGGWGNLGGGVTQLFMPVVFELFKGAGNSDSASWRLAMMFPAIFLGIMGVVCFCFSEDSPRGNFSDLVAAGTKKKVTATSSAKGGFGEPMSWIFAAQYACCFGVELTVNNSMVSYFVYRFDLGLVTAGTIAMCFGLQNLYARACGGIISDWANTKMQVRGRLIVHMIILFLEGILLVIFSRMDQLGGAIFMLVCFSCFVQAAEGTTYSIVPYVNPESTGAVTGVVGAGGNFGAVCWGLIFLYSGWPAEDCFMAIGIIVMALALATPLVFLKGDHDSVFGPNPRKISPPAGA